MKKTLFAALFSLAALAAARAQVAVAIPDIPDAQPPAIAAPA